MTIEERVSEVIINKFDDFGNKMSDGRLTEPSNGSVYRLRKAILN